MPCTDHMNNVIFKRISYIQTKHHLTICVTYPSLFPSILTRENGQCDLRRFLPFSFGWRGLKLAGTYTETRLHFGFSKRNQP